MENDPALGEKASLPISDHSLTRREWVQRITKTSTMQPTSPNRLETNAEESRSGAELPPLNTRDCLDYLKGWISLAYYLSETGRKNGAGRGITFSRVPPAASTWAAMHSSGDRVNERRFGLSGFWFT
jgi:hypothetical protein